METSNPLPFASDMPGAVTTKSSPEEKVKIFRSLFRGRDDVYAVRWENRTGKAGYSTACRKVCGNPFQNRSADSKEYFPLTAATLVKASMTHGSTHFSLPCRFPGAEHCNNTLAVFIVFTTASVK